MEHAEAYVISILPQLQARPVQQGVVVVVPPAKHGHTDLLKMKQANVTTPATDEKQSLLSLSGLN